MTNGELFDRYARTRDVALRNEIVEKYLYMVDILIRKYLNKGVDYDDLYQVGAMALIMAVERFDPSKGFEFPSFATPTILGEIKKYFRDKMWSVSVPRRLKELSAKLPQAMEKLTESLGRSPSIDEIAEELGESRKDVLSAMESGRAYEAQSLDMAYDAANGDTYDPLEKYASGEEEGYERVEFAELLSGLFATLSDTERRIIDLRYTQDKTQAETAEILGISQMTVSRAEKKMKERFREALRQ